MKLTKQELYLLYQKEYREKNKEKINFQKEKNKEKHKEYIKRYNKKYYKKNKEYILEITKKWRENNRDKYLEINKKYYENNKLKYYENSKIWRENNKFKRNVEAKTQYNRKNNPLKYKCYCEICNSTKNIHQHHTDYNKPYKVIALCCSCHNKLHKEVMKNRA